MIVSAKTISLTGLMVSLCEGTVRQFEKLNHNSSMAATISGALHRTVTERNRIRLAIIFLTLHYCCVLFSSLLPVMLAIVWFFSDFLGTEVHHFPNFNFFKASYYFFFSTHTSSALHKFCAKLIHNSFSCLDNVSG